MDKLLNGCGSVLIAIGVIAVGVAIFLRVGGAVAQRWGGEAMLQAVLLFSGGVGTIISGIFFLGLGEIIARLPEIPEPGKRCPQCAEEVKREALKCRFCGFTFDPTVVVPKRDSTTRLRPCPHCRKFIPRDLDVCDICHQAL